MDKLSGADHAKELIALHKQLKAAQSDIEMLIKSRDEYMLEHKRFRDALEYISFSSNVCPERYDGEDVSKQCQKIISDMLRRIGKEAERALQPTGVRNE